MIYSFHKSNHLIPLYGFLLQIAIIHSLTVPCVLSVMSMLAEPNTESPANVDAAKMWREDRLAFKKKACSSVRKSLDMP